MLAAVGNPSGALLQLLKRGARGTVFFSSSTRCDYKSEQTQTRRTGLRTECAYRGRMLQSDHRSKRSERDDERMVQRD